MSYPRKCAKCGEVNVTKRIANGKEICRNCRTEFPKPKKREVVGMMDSTGIVRCG